MKAQGFPKAARLLKAEDFVSTKARGKRRAGPHLVIWANKNNLEYARLGLAVSRKVGKSHDRNLLKRRTRELFRKRICAFKAGYDYVIVFKPGAGELDFPGLRAELERAL